MCWYSTDLSKDILQAEAGQRVGIRKVHGCSWVVRESDLHKQSPTPVCLIDRTSVLFRFPEFENVASNAATEAKAVFRMLTKPKRDVFQFLDGREAGVDTLPSDLIFDVLEVPGKGEFSTLLQENHSERALQEEMSERRPLLERVLQLF